MSQASSSSSGGRFLFIDNLRIVLTALVMAHHAAVPYMSGHWYYSEPVRHNFWSDALLGFFLSVNAAYFMGFFFLLAGFFVPSSFDRKGPLLFMKDRLLRLGVPLLIYTVSLGPLLSYVGQVVIPGNVMSFSQFLQVGLSRWGVDTGPLWFVVVLLIFTLTYTVMRLLLKWKLSEKPSSPKIWAIALTGLIIAGITFRIRATFPMDYWVSFLKFIHFEPSHFPQYITLFIVGLIAYRRNWFHQLTDVAGKAWSIVAVLLIFSWPVLMVAGGATHGLGSRFFSGLFWQQLAYALWETFTCLAMIISLIYLFRRYFNKQNPLMKALSASAFTAYVIHPVFIVAVQFALRSFDWHPILKFTLVSIVGVPVCFFAANMVRQLPGFRVVLDQPRVKTL